MAINQNSGKAFDKWGAIPGSQIGWYYNWYATKTEGVPSNWEYVPILHRETQNFQSSELSFSSWGVKNVLSFNEPDVRIRLFMYLIILTLMLKCVYNGISLLLRPPPHYTIAKPSRRRYRNECD